MRRPNALTACALTCVLLCGCSGATVKTSTTTVSIGQQLIDLQTSYHSGAMTEAQYDKARQELIKRALN